MRRIQMVPHDPSWSQAFARESAAVLPALGDITEAIHHIGSTAIPGICAKPVIDMMAAVTSIHAVESRNARLEAIGYEAMGEFGIPGRRYFRKDDAAGNRTHQLHVFEAGSPQIERHLAFRDFMRAHEAFAMEYADLKRRLADQYPTDLDAYCDGKDAFIKAIDEEAAAWRRSGEQVLREI